MTRHNSTNIYDTEGPDIIMIITVLFQRTLYNPYEPLQIENNLMTCDQHRQISMYILAVRSKSMLLRICMDVLLSISDPISIDTIILHRYT